jgi:hypothetical protein
MTLECVISGVGMVLRAVTNICARVSRLGEQRGKNSAGTVSKHSRPQPSKVFPSWKACWQRPYALTMFIKRAFSASFQAGVIVRISDSGRPPKIFAPVTKYSQTPDMTAKPNKAGPTLVKGTIDIVARGLGPPTQEPGWQQATIPTSFKGFH